MFFLIRPKRKQDNTDKVLTDVVQEVEEVVPLVHLSRAEVAFEKVVLNMVHNHVVQAVEPWWDSNEWGDNEIEQMLPN